MPWFKKFIRHPQLILGGGFLVIILGACLLAPNLSTHHPEESDFRATHLKPSLFDQEPSSHLLGTDDKGFDIYSRLLHGGSLTLKIAFLAISLSFVIGVPLGASAAFLGKQWDETLMRFTDLILSFPAILWAIAIVTPFRDDPSADTLGLLTLALGIVGIPAFARQSRSAVQQVLVLDYVLASRALGASPLRLLRQVILPNCWAPLIVVASLSAAGVVLEVAGLSFIGLGAPPGTAEWGLMLAESQHLIHQAPWAVIFPGLALMVTVLSLNMVGDALRDALDMKI